MEFFFTIAAGGNGKIRARALLCPVQSTGGGNKQPLPMVYRSLTIGTDGDSDLCLYDYGHCNYVSHEHAHIFYDEVSFFLCIHL